jgi:hypothetical protein
MTQIMMTLLPRQKRWDNPKFCGVQTVLVRMEEDTCEKSRKGHRKLGLCCTLMRPENF